MLDNRKLIGGEANRRKPTVCPGDRIATRDYRLVGLVTCRLGLFKGRVLESNRVETEIQCEPCLVERAR